MDPLAVKAFARRDWQQASASKTAYWAEQFRRDWRTTWEAAQALLNHARQVRTPFPGRRDREADFAFHLSFRVRLDRASDAFTRR
jgi:hypothetical protein